MAFRLYSRQKPSKKRRTGPSHDGAAPAAVDSLAADARRAKYALSGFQELNVTRDFEIPATGRITLPMAQLGDEK